MNEAALRGLRVAVVVMGVLIVVGVVGLVAALGYRAAGRSAAGRSVAAGGPAVAIPGEAPGTAPGELVLDEPAGTRIMSVAAGDGRLVVALQGGGPDRAVVVDGRSGQVVQRVRLAR